MEGFRSGFAAVVGRPNVGKSTLLNHLIGQKLLIVSDKPQATRNRISCVLTRDDYQIVFLDTPGIHKPRHKLGEIMVKYARDSLVDVDCIIFMVEAEEKIGPGDRYIAELLSQLETPVILAINKIDRLESISRLLPVLDMWSKEYDFAEYIGVSALTGENLDVLEKCIVEYLPEGPKYYPDDMITDQPERFVIAELIREKVFAYTREEVPHSTAVDIPHLEDRDNLTYIAADIVVERDSQKGIVVGKEGQRLKAIGIEARKDIEKLLGTQVYLDLYVRTKKDWRNRAAVLAELGYRKE